MLEIVAGIGDHYEICARHDAAQPQGELGATDATAQRNNETAICGGAHRNRSSSAGRIKAAPGKGDPDHGTPRTSTIGLASSACPITSDAALAISSANPVWVTRSARSNRSG